MIDICKKLSAATSLALNRLFGASVSEQEIQFQQTRKTFEGDYTLVVFPYLKISKQKPEATARLIGTFLSENVAELVDFNVVKGFLNLVISDDFWVQTLQEIQRTENFGQYPAQNRKIMVEYSSPNTNKPLHLGHLRNNFLGYALALILRKRGAEVLRTNLVNDRGIHICKSMLAYQKFGKGAHPSPQCKGDKLVGNYYVRFNEEHKAEAAALREVLKRENPEQSEEKRAEEAEKKAPIFLEAQAMLRKWEAGDPETVALWKKMNSWVYDGFEESYKTMGVSFDKIYRESETYLLGRAVVLEGLEKGIFYEESDGSVWVNLESEGLDKKLLLRADGTSVYMTQDMGTADLKYKDFPMDDSIYVVGNEQDYHFKVLKLIMQKLGRVYASGIYHLSYGMVDLPSGKMKSREGTVVDADDLISEMKAIAKEKTLEQGKISHFSEAEAEKLYLDLALGALKFYLLRVEPKKRMIFNPSESIDFQGDTGVYIQYNHARLCAIVRKAKQMGIDYSADSYGGVTKIGKVAVELIILLRIYPEKVREAAQNYAPSVIAAFALEVAKTYSKLYAGAPIFNEENEKLRAFRVALSLQTAKIIADALALLGIAAPEKM